MINDVITFLVRVISTCLSLFDQLLDATETRELWIAAVGFVAFVSIVLLPFRSGHPIGGGGFIGFAADRVGRSRREREAKERRDQRIAAWKSARRSTRSYHDG